ncbi:hypothetical protein Gasu_65420, partial [Galdieria sulphuraria]
AVMPSADFADFEI